MYSFLRAQDVAGEKYQSPQIRQRLEPDHLRNKPTLYRAAIKTVQVCFVPIGPADICAVVF